MFIRDDNHYLRCEISLRVSKFRLKIINKIFINLSNNNSVHYFPNNLIKRNNNSNNIEN